MPVVDILAAWTVFSALGAIAISMRRFYSRVLLGIVPWNSAGVDLSSVLILGKSFDFTWCCNCCTSLWLEPHLHVIGQDLCAFNHSCSGKHLQPSFPSVPRSLTGFTFMVLSRKLSSMFL